MLLDSVFFNVYLTRLEVSFSGISLFLFVFIKQGWNLQLLCISMLMRLIILTQLTCQPVVYSPLLTSLRFRIVTVEFVLVVSVGFSLCFKQSWELAIGIVSNYE